MNLGNFLDDLGNDLGQPTWAMSARPVRTRDRYKGVPSDGCCLSPVFIRDLPNCQQDLNNLKRNNCQKEEIKNFRSPSSLHQIPWFDQYSMDLQEDLSHNQIWENNFWNYYHYYYNKVLKAYWSQKYCWLLFLLFEAFELLFLLLFLFLLLPFLFFLFFFQILFECISFLNFLGKENLNEFIVES